MIKGLGNDPNLEVRDAALQPCGLRNLGATCYMNSLLQALFHNLAFREFVTHLKPHKKWDEDGVVGGIQHLFAHLHLSREAVYNPQSFVSLLNISAGVQQDAQEFNKLLLSLLEDTLEKAPGKRIRSFLPEMFAGQSVYVTTCSDCGYTSQSATAFYELVSQNPTHFTLETRPYIFRFAQELGIRGRDSIIDSLEHLVTPESLVGDDMWVLKVFTVCPEEA